MLRVAVITSSDRSYRGERADGSGPAIVEMAKNAGLVVVETLLLPDERDQLAEAMKRIADENIADLILTTGGTGFAPRDITPEATMDVCERMVPGIPEAMRYHSLQITPKAMLSRATAGIRKRTLIVNLPGSTKAVQEMFPMIEKPLIHGIKVLVGIDKDCAPPK